MSDELNQEGLRAAIKAGEDAYYRDFTMDYIIEKAIRAYLPYYDEQNAKLVPVLINVLRYADGKCHPEVQAAIDHVLSALPTPQQEQEMISKERIERAARIMYEFDTGINGSYARMIKDIKPGTYGAFYEENRRKIVSAILTADDSALAAENANLLKLLREAWDYINSADMAIEQWFYNEMQQALRNEGGE